MLKQVMMMICIVAVSPTLAACGNADTAPIPDQVTSVSTVDTPDDLSLVVTEFEKLFVDGNVGDSVDYIPPKLKSNLLQDTGVSEQQLKQVVQQSWNNSLETVTVEELEFDLEAYAIDSVPSGALFKRIPTRMVFGVNDNPNAVIDSNSDTLAIMDNDAWYLVRLDQAPQVELFRTAYPEYSNVEISPQSMEMRERGTQ